MADIREKIIEAGEFAFSRHLTDLAGGNISIREGSRMYITPRYAGARLHWRLTPDNIVVGEINNDDIRSNPSFSREGISHLAIYRAFPETGAIIHAHPFHILPFCAAHKPIPPVIRAAQKFGEIDFIDDTPAYSQEQADSIVHHLLGKNQMIKESAAALLMPRHGIIIAAKDLDSALDCLERIDTNAWCIIVQKGLE